MKKGSKSAKSVATSEETTEALLAAIQSRDVKAVRSAIAAGADVRSTRGEKCPIELAVTVGNAKIVQLLIEKDASAPADQVAALLIQATDHPRILSQLLKSKLFDPNLFNVDGWTPLMVAAEAGDDKSVRELLRGGADPNLQRDSDEGETAYYLAHREDHLHVTEILQGVTDDELIAKAESTLGPGDMERAVLFIEDIKANRITEAEAALKDGMDPNTSVDDDPPLFSAAVASEEMTRLLLDYGADINAWNLMGYKLPPGVDRHQIPDDIELWDGPPLEKLYSYNVLLASIYHAAPETIRLLIQRGADVNAVAYDGTSTPLNKAVESSRLEVIEMLVEAGADIHFEGYKGRKPAEYRNPRASNRSERDKLLRRLGMLDEATEALLTGEVSDPSKLSNLLDEGLDPNTLDDVGRSCLYLAIFRGQDDQAKQLIQAGADLDLRVTWDESIDHRWAGARRPCPKCGAVVVAPTDRVECQGCGTKFKASELKSPDLKRFTDSKLHFHRGEMTILGLASRLGKIDIVKSLFQAGARLHENADSKILKTAIWFDHHDVAEVLLDQGAALNQDMSWDPEYTAITLAASRGNFDLYSQLQKRGGKSKLRSSSLRKIGLVGAAEVGQSDWIDKWIETGADVNSLALADASRSVSHTALCVAALHGQEAAVETLLKLGANVNKKNKKERSPLMLAAQQGHKAIVEKLIDAGANLKRDGKPARNLASRNGFKEISQLIKISSGTN